MLQRLRARLSDPARPFWRALVIVSWAIVLNLVFLLQPTFIRGGDAAFHIFNTQEFATGIREGTLYPRWFGDVFNGYGAPTGLGYAPFTYYSGAVFMLVGMNVFTALKVMLTITLVIAGLGMYRLAGAALPPLSALIAALLYQAMPYYIFDLYSRAALGEYVSFAWLPFIFLFTYRCIHDKRLVYVALLGLSLGVLLLTHVLTAYITAIALAIFAICLIVLERKDWPWKVVRLGVAGALGIGLAAVYWLPLLTETPQLNTSHLTEASFGDYRNNFLFNAWGYLGTTRQSTFLENTIIGLGALLSIALAVCAAFILYRQWQRYPRPRRDLMLAMIFVFGFSSLMCFSISRPLWAILPRIEILQFPSRWQSLSALATAYLIGELFTWFGEQRSQISGRPRGLSLVIIALIAAHVIYSIGLIGALTYLRRAIPTDMAAQLTGIQPITPENFDRFFPIEYITQWVDEDMTPYKRTPVNQQQGVIADDGTAKVDIQTWQLARRAFTVDSSKPTVVMVQTFWFPGWQATINGQAIDENLLSDEGLIQLNVPAGTSEVEVSFTDTSVRTTGAIITLLTAGLLAGILIFSLTRRPGVGTKV